MKFCKCGCGGRVSKEGNKYIRGHTRKGKKNTQQHNDRIRKSNKGRKPAPQTLEAARQATMGKPGTFTGRRHTKESIDRMVKAHTGHKVSKETRNLMSQVHRVVNQDPLYKDIQSKIRRERLSDPVEKVFFLSTTSKGEGYSQGKSEWYISPSAGKVYLRSSWESWIARWLDERNIPWEYAKLNVSYNWKDGTEHIYQVDFHCLDRDGKYCIECKGYDSDEWQRKKTAFYQQYPEMFLKVILSIEDLRLLKLRTWDVSWMGDIPTFKKKLEVVDINK